MSSSGASVSAATGASRKSIRQSILSSFQPAAILNHEDPMPLSPTAGRSIKVVPYVNGRQVIGIAILIIWPIVLGTAFNVYSFEEASAYLEIRLDVERYQARVERVQGVIDTLVTAQDTLLQSLIQRNGRATQVAADFGRTATQELQSLDAAYPELTENHKRVTPKVILDKLTAWIAGVRNFDAVDPTNLVDNLSEVIKGVRMFFSVYHVTSLRGGDTWNNVLQQLFISEVRYRLKEVSSFGNYAYGTLSPSSAMSDKLRLTLLRRYQRSLIALDLYCKYSLPEFQIDNLQKTCRQCNWTFLRTRKTQFWRSIVPQIVTLDNRTSVQSVLNTTVGAHLAPSAAVVPVTLYVHILNESLYPIEIAHEYCEKVVSDRFKDELDVGASVFGGTLFILIVWLILTTNLLGLVARSLAGIFSESYRFQWVQLCRRRAIEREKSRSDKIVAEMFFEMNFKYLYEGNLPPTVLYKDATIAFVELLQYAELCRIYTTVDHVAILDWYYHLVSAAVKGYNTNVVATAGHYCLLAGTHAYHAENVALCMLRLMTLVQDSYLPPPHNTKLPLIRAGIHTGPVAGAIVSLKFPLFTMLGDTVNTAARMNSKSRPYCVLLSETSNGILGGNFTTTNAGIFNVKGKGQMNTYWLLSCNWKTFGENFIDLNRAEELRKVHDLEVELHESSMMHHRRTGFGKTHAHTVFENGAGIRRRSSSVNDGSIAGLGGDLLAAFIRSKKRGKSKRTTRALPGGGPKPKRQSLTASQIRPEQRSGPDATETGNNFGMIQTGRYAPRNSVFKPANYTSNIKEKQHDRGTLSANIVLKASPNESYYIQVANNVHMRSWKMSQ